MWRTRTFVSDCPTLTEKERKWHDEERERNREKRKENPESMWNLKKNLTS